MRRRTYEVETPLAKALDALGGRWTLLILECLRDGPLRYKDIYTEMYGISTNLLADRLKWLVELGLVEREKRGRHIRYRITFQAMAITKALDNLSEWAELYLDKEEAA